MQMIYNFQIPTNLQDVLNLDIMLLKFCNIFIGREEFLQYVNFDTRCGMSPFSKQKGKQELNNLL